MSILKYDGTATLKQIWFWEDTANGMGDVAAGGSGIRQNLYPIDVAAGDLDGDFMDEVVVAARVGDGGNDSIQLVGLDVTNRTATPLTIDSSLWMNRAINCKDYWAPNTISVATGDFEGDGADEIALAFSRYMDDGATWDAWWDHHLVTYEYVTYDQPEFATACTGSTSKTACFKARSGSLDTTDRLYNDSVPTQEWRLSVATGDLDRDNMDEIGMIRFKFEGGANEVEVRVYDADTGLVLRGTPWTTDLGANQPQHLVISMGDRDGDSVWGDYVEGSCWLLKEAHLQSVLYAPPHWPEGHPAANDGTAGSAFGVESLVEKGSTVEQSKGIGSSVATEIPIKEFKISFTKGWEKEAFSSKTTSTTTSQGTDWATCPAANPDCAADPTYNGVQFIEVTNRCYIYADKAGTTGNIDVCLPYSMGGNRFSQNWWYKFGPTLYPESWTPVGINMAQGRTASQSNQDPGWPADPQRAVDGKTDGVYSNGSVAHTGAALVVGGVVSPSYWQVDLGGKEWIGAVQLWNRTDSGYTNHLKDFYVFVSEEPLDMPVAALRAATNVWKKYVSGEAGRATIVPVDTEGRYVRVQLFGPDASPGDGYAAGGPGISATSTTWLDLAELQVYGMPGQVDQWPNAKPVPGDGSFTVTWPYNGASLTQKVTGKFVGMENTTVYQAIKPQSQSVKVSLGFGDTTEIEEGTSLSESRSLGMGFRRMREVTVTQSEKYSSSTSWENTIGFYGEVPGLPKALCPDPTLPSCIKTYNYQFSPFAWQQQEISNQSFRQAFLVQGWWVPASGSAAAPPADVGPAAEASRTGPDAKPALPVIDSSTHPNPAVWVNNSTATTIWKQPAGDPAVVVGYNWQLDQVAGTVPAATNYGLTKTDTHYNLPDGVWYMHARAVSNGGQWSDTAHRTIRADAHAPVVKLAVDPPSPTGAGGYYITSVTVTLTADDGGGSGVAKLEYTTDGMTWQPYNASLVFGSDTPGTTVQARASDVAGLVSEPVSVLLKIDRTAPDSRVAGGAGPGAYVAEVATNALGNEELVLAGAVKDDASGISSMNVAWDGLDSATIELRAAEPVAGLPGVTANWRFPVTQRIGAGYHIFTASALDGAGNAEPPYELARVLWYPQAAPDLAGSSMQVARSAIGPGDTVLFTVFARNAGWQEAHVAVVDQLPAGLTPVMETQPPDATYDPAAGTLTWPAELLWPGQTMQRSFQAQAAIDLPLTKLENRAVLRASWPNTDLLPTADRQKFLDKEQTVTVSASLTVDPALPANADRTAPWALLVPHTQEVTAGAGVMLGIPAAEDATRMYLREWTLDRITGDWIVAKSSGWLPYTRTLDWTLSAGQGSHYLGVWVADAAGNVSTLNELHLTWVNRMDGSQALAAGERIQYRGFAQEGEEIGLWLTTQSGDPDLYVWKPWSAFRPDGYTDAATTPGEKEGFGYTRIAQTGRYIVEVGAAEASEYAFSVEGTQAAQAGAAGALAAKPRPARPLTVSDPLSAGQVGEQVTRENPTYLPVIFR